MDYFVCIDIGGTSIKFGVLTSELNFVTYGEMPTEAQKGGVSIIKKIIAIVTNYQKSYKILGICVSSAGIVDVEKGEIIYANELIPNYTGTKIKDIMEKNFSIPCEIENDVNCAGLAEYFAGAAKGSSIALTLTVGTGIGGSIIINDRIFRGFSGSACEVGYINVMGHKFEQMAASSILVKKVSEGRFISVDQLNGKQIFEEAQLGVQDCIQAIDEMVDYLGIGIADICYVLNPEIIILGGGIMAQKEYLYPRIRKSINKYLIPQIASKTKLAFAQQQNKAGMLGAYFNFRQRQG